MIIDVKNVFASIWKNEEKKDGNILKCCFSAYALSPCRSQIVFRNVFQSTYDTLCIKHILITYLFCFFHLLIGFICFFFVGYCNIFAHFCLTFCSSSLNVSTYWLCYWFDGCSENFFPPVVYFWERNKTIKEK